MKFVTFNVSYSRDRARAVITILGNYAFSQIVSVSKKNLLRCTFEEIKTMLLERFCTKQTWLYERVQFNRVVQLSGESISDFKAKIEKAASKCEFKPKELETRLLERFTSGLRREKTIDLLICDPEINYKKAIKTATIHETRDLYKTKTVIADVSKITKPCFRCGKANHNHYECKYKEFTCNTCGVKGHLAKTCKKSNGNQSSRSSNSKKNKAVKDISILNISNSCSAIELLTLSINGKKVKFEVDTGAGMSLFSKEFLQKNLPFVKLKESDVRAKSVKGDYLKIIGEFSVNLKGRLFWFYVMDAYLKHPIIGRDGLDIVVPDWRKSFTVNHIVNDQDQLKQSLLEEFKVVFNNDYKSPIKDIKIKIKLKEGAQPIFARPYEVPLSKKLEVEKELERWVSEPVKYSSWASPIVCVTKKSGGVRICANFKNTLNPKILINQYHLPTVDEVIHKIGSGKSHYAVIDLSNAYLQLSVDESSRELLTINTHKGLFRFLRVPFGLADAHWGKRGQKSKI